MRSRVIAKANSNMTLRKATAIAEERQQWPGVIQSDSEFELPIIVEPIPELALHAVDCCANWTQPVVFMVSRDSKSIRDRWRGEHGWSIRNIQGGSGPDNADTIK